MKCPLFLFAQESPKQIAYRDDENILTAYELNQWVEGTAVKLEREGIKPCDRVSFQGTITLQTIVLLFSLLRIGAIACPLNFRNPLLPLNALDSIHIDLRNFTIEKGSYREVEIDEEACALFLFTSGSTAIPKIAALSLANFFYNALGALKPLALTSQDTWHLSLPLYHVGGLSILFRCFLAHAAIVVGKEGDNASFVSLVPTQLYRALQQGKSLQNRSLLLGGAPLIEELCAQATKKGARVFCSYGMTEMGSLITLNNAPLKYREVMIDAEGEICVRGKTLFKGYWDKERGLTLPVDEEGWFKTKDLGYWSKGKTLSFVGRKDNLFISGGENIQPEEIEKAICLHCNVEAAFVVPIKDPEFGEVPVVFIKEALTIEAIKLALLPILPKYKIPRAVFPLPQTDNLKISRKALRHLADNGNYTVCG